MDDKGPSARASGIPRLSRLPLPRPTPTLRPAASRESLNGGDQLRNPRLRPAASRDRLSLSSGPVAAPRKNEAPASTKSPPPIQPSPRNRLNSSQSATNAQKTPSRPRDGGGTYPKTPSAATARSLTRRTSQQFSLGTPAASTPARSAKTTNSVEEVLDSRPATSSTDKSFPSLRTSASQSFRPRPSLSERTIETLSQLPSSPAIKGRASISSSGFFDLESARRPPSRPGSQGSRPGSCHRPGSSNRPGSSHLSDGSSRPPSRSLSRPGSSSGQDERSFSFRASTNTFSAPLPPIAGTPVRSRPTRTLKTPSACTTPGASIRSTSSKPQKAPVVGLTRARTPSPSRAPLDAVPKSVPKTVAARTVKSRPSLNGLFKKPSKRPSIAALGSQPHSEAPRKGSMASQRSSTTSGEETLFSSASTTSTNPTLDSAAASPAPMTTNRKSSAALREQIAKAKAAKRAASRQVSAAQAADIQEAPVVPTDTGFDFGLSDDPFNLRRDDGSMSKVIQARAASARTTGRLNIAAMGLREIPKDVLSMYDLESIGKHDGTWAESVDLTRFVAADNELEMIEESVFPDAEPEELANNEDEKGSIFGGLETLDLHGNVLISLPTGLRRLSLLTSLNLSQNRLANNCLETISQITSLRDLKLGGNLLYGDLDPWFISLENLEILDLHGNNLTGLPQGLENSSKLRILNISENNFESIPFYILARLPITELLARKNKLSGVLIDNSTEELPHLQILDISSNQITQLISPTEGRSIALPAVTQLCLSMNRLQSLPDVSFFTNLITLTADENSINAIPEGFTKLTGLRSVDFSSNDIRVIPAEIARMDNLAMLRLSGNPLRDKKFVSMATDDLKNALAARLEPEVVTQEDGAAQSNEGISEEPMNASETCRRERAPSSASAIAEPQPRPADEPDQDNSSRSDMDDFATPPTSAPGTPVRSRSHTISGQTWPIKSGGVLDRSNTQSSSLHPVICSRVAAEHTVREIQLHHNLFTTLPESLSFFAESLTSLSLAHNQLIGETYMGAGEELELPCLKELNLSSNHITSLVPLVAHLRAPSLQKLDLSFNRLSSLPAGSQLRDAYPGLTVLLIANNHLADLDPESIKGLRIVDARNNDIAHLNPRIGLLGGAGGLERLEVAGNRFRVPRWNVLERGTEATLRWLRGRVPVAEMGAWKDGEGEGDGETSLADLD
ncbi:Leucine-rich repeat-containing protein 40 [Pleurostoma richardsiae]|uniref:Leucine-rich repeat-containing protein 40 n=1 Tax=Pleurostoma richardsiae TaxID=41990 RepID=A0AA38VR73_9PEZI|nr:Leucine-rich repeat-containing protein 40 [Pleurostoma richardsiae]